MPRTRNLYTLCPPMGTSRLPRDSAGFEPPPVDRSSSVAGLLQDLRYALRVQRRQPRFAALVIGLTALGIGATAALFSVTYDVLAKPLPWPNADRVVSLLETRGGNRARVGAFTNVVYLAWQEDARTLDGLAAWNVCRRSWLEDLVAGRSGALRPRRGVKIWLLLTLEAWLRQKVKRAA